MSLSSPSSLTVSWLLQLLAILALAPATWRVSGGDEASIRSRDGQVPSWIDDGKNQLMKQLRLKRIIGRRLLYPKDSRASLTPIVARSITFTEQVVEPLGITREAI